MSFRKQTILVDCDGVLADFVGGLCAGLNRYDYQRSPGDFKNWALDSALSSAENALLPAIVGAPNFCAKLEAYPEDHVNILGVLRNFGHEVVCVTSPWPSESWMPERVEWLRPLFPARDVVFASSTHKARIQADVLVEDHPGTCVAWLQHNPKGFALLVDRPWNSPSAQEYVPHPRMIRVPKLRSVLNFVVMP